MPSGAGAGRPREIVSVWAQTPDRVIGAAGDIPWDVPEDRAHFKAVTDGHPVVMGRLTWESLPPRVRPLPGRDNIVLTSDPEYRADGASVVPDLAAALAATVGRDVAIVGGGRVYADAMDLATALEITEVDVAVAGDAFAPVVDDRFVAVRTGQWHTSRSGTRYRHVRYERADDPDGSDPDGRSVVIPR